MTKLWRFALCCLLLPALAMAKGVHEYTLSNGLKLIVKEDHRAPMVVNQVWYKVGGSYEPLGITGVSHALEHMMFKGTNDVPNDDFSRLITANGGMDNAMTSRDFTMYYQQIPAKELGLAFKLEADRMHNLQLRQKDFDKEIKVVREERRLRTEDNPQALTYERFNAMAFVSTPYHHPVVGWMDDLMHMQLSDLQNWYENWYVPNNAIVVVVGDVNPEKVFNLAKKYFGPVPSRQVPRVYQETEVRPLGEKDLTVRVPAKLPWLIMGYQVPSVKHAPIKWEPYALVVLDAILAGSDSSRLQSDLVRGSEIATEVAGGYDPFTRLDGLLIIAGTPAPGHTSAQLKSALKREVGRLRKYLVSKAELQRVKTQVIANKVYAKDSMQFQGMELGQLAVVGLPWQLSQQFVKNIEAVTPAQIRAVARKYLVSDRVTVARLIPLAKDKKVAKHKG